MEADLSIPGGDLALELLSWAGVVLSALLAFGDRLFGMWAGVPLLLWGMYLSLINLEARVVIGYGWEWETVEVGFLVIFLCPTWPSLTRFPRRLPPPTAVIWLLRWATFRLLLGAGMSKLGERSSDCWKELSCTETHYFTQPMPNFMAWFFHRLPSTFHHCEVALTFVEQLVLPFAVLVPFRPVRIAACLAELFFQLCIVGTGNYAWINWIGALPCLALLDDAFLVSIGLFTAETAAEASAADADADANANANANADADADADAAARAATTPAASMPAAESHSASRGGDQDARAGEEPPRTPRTKRSHLDVDASDGARTDAAGGNGSAPGSPGGTPVDAASLLRAVAASPDTPKAAARKGRTRKSRTPQKVPGGSDGDDGGRIRTAGNLGAQTNCEMAKAAVPPPAPHSPPPPPPPRRGTAWHAINVAYKTFRAAVHLGLVMFIAGKSAEPMKELFGKAPWLSYYDDYFFVNAQGVFGFINQHRVTLVLHYTHDTLPPLDSKLVAEIASCKDPGGTPVRGNNDVRYSCRQIAPYCSSNPHLTTLCPKTCGGCPTRDWSEKHLAAIRWRPLHFKNLPGDLTRMPTINSPYHYRLDWETWIATTASMETTMSAWRKQGSVLLPSSAMPVPQIHTALIDKLLLGDTDAINLMGTTVHELLNLGGNVGNASAGGANVGSSSDGGNANGNSGAAETSVTAARAPTAIRAEFYSYRFSDWKALWTKGEWWSREQMSKPRVFEAAASTQGNKRKKVGGKKDEPERQQHRRSPWQRHWLLLAACTGLWRTVASAWLPNKVHFVWLAYSMWAALSFVACFGLVLLKDYPGSRDNFLRHLGDAPAAFSSATWWLDAKGRCFYAVELVASTFLAVVSVSCLVLSTADAALRRSAGCSLLIMGCILVLAFDADRLQAQLDLLP